MNAVTFSDEEIITAIKSGGRKRQEVIRFLYQDDALKNKIVYFVKRNSGNLEDGQDMVAIPVKVHLTRRETSTRGLNTRFLQTHTRFRRVCACRMIPRER